MVFVLPQGTKFPKKYFGSKMDPKSYFCAHVESYSETSEQ